MKRKILSLVIVSVVMTISGTGVSAQYIFFPTKEGFTWVFADLDAKGKTGNYSRQTIKKSDGSGDNYTITYLFESLDKNQKPVGGQSQEILYTVNINNGVVELDLKSLLKSTGNDEALVEIEGDRLKIPPTLAIGDKLDDVKIIISMEAGGMKFKSDMTLTEQQCIAIEDVTVPAGTFKCHKVTQTNTLTIMRRATITKTVSWFAPDIGTVKTEEYDAKGKLQSSRVLHSVKN